MEHSRCVVVASPHSAVAVLAVHAWPTFNAGISVIGQQLRISSLEIKLTTLLCPMKPICHTGLQRKSL